MGELKQRGRIWWIRYSRNGKRFEESARSTKKGAAIALLKLREGDQARGVPVTPQMGRLTFEDCVASVVNDYKVNGRKTLAHAQRRIDKHLQPYFGRRRMADITTDDVNAFTVRRLDAGASNAEINRELALLKRMFTLAVDGKQLMVKPHIPMLKERNVRAGFFESAAFDAVRAALPAALQPVVTFAYFTGWRVPSEVLTLEWRQVDFAAGEVTLDPETTKNGEARTFPFAEHDGLRTLLVEQRAEAAQLKRKGIICPLVFHRHGKPIRDFYGAWRSACKRAGCPGRIPHDFRRTAVRNLSRAGVPDTVSMKLTGHLTRSVFDRYRIASKDDLRDAARRLNQLHGTKVGQSGTSAESATA